MSVLVLIEDDPAIRTALERALSRRGHAVYAAPTAMAGLELVTSRSPDVVVLDLGLPDVDGTQVLGMIRGVSAVPVIVATARDDENEMVRVLDARCGRLRGQAVLGASSSRPGCGRCCGAAGRPTSPTRRWSSAGSSIDRSHPGGHAGRGAARPDPRGVRPAGLPGRPGRARWSASGSCWPRSGSSRTGARTSTVDVHLSWLRRKLGETAAEPRYLQTVRGVGVKLVDPDAAT